MLGLQQVRHRPRGLLSNLQAQARVVLYARVQSVACSPAHDVAHPKARRPEFRIAHRSKGLRGGDLACDRRVEGRRPGWSGAKPRLKAPIIFPDRDALTKRKPVPRTTQHTQTDTTRRCVTVFRADGHLSIYRSILRSAESRVPGAKIAVIPRARWTHMIGRALE